MILALLPAVSQVGNQPDYSSGSVEDPDYCGKNISAYREFFIKELYVYAHEPWVKVFRDCPGSSEKMYVDGVTMYRSFIEKASEGPAREGLIDTLMLIYDRRIENFGGEGNVLGRKGRDLLAYRGTDMDQVQDAHEMLKRSIELMGKESQESVLVFLVSAGSLLMNQGIMDETRFFQDYMLVIDILDSMESGTSRIDRARKSVDEIIQKNDIQICDALDRFFSPQIEQNRDDLPFLEKVILNYKSAGCDRSEIYLEASEEFYEINPEPEAARNLAILFITRNELGKAARYLEEAVKGENTERETRAEWYYELAVVSLANGNHCRAIDAAREAIELKSSYAKAYMILGDAIIASGQELEDEFQQRTAYWAAADKYKNAASADPSVKEEADEKLALCRGQFPSQEDIFFNALNEGDSYRVEGCINENTSVRARK